MSARISVLLGSVLLLACGGDRGLTWSYRFEAPSLRDETTLLEASVLTGGCAGPAEWSASFARGATAATPPALPAGRYGLRVRARDAMCRWIATDCVELDLPSEQAGVVLALTGITPPELACAEGDSCTDGQCDGEDDDAGTPPDGGPPPSDGGACAGCWDGSTCVTGDAIDACGRGGEACQACSCGGDACTDGACVPRTPADQTSAGDDHSCAVAGGRLFCWGDSNVFQVSGFGTFSMPVEIGEEHEWTAVQAAGKSTCGLRDGVIDCWGSNFHSQLGLGAEGPENAFEPMRVVGSQTWTDVELGTAHGCGLDDAGALWCWGSNENASITSAAPVAVVEPFEIDLGGPVSDVCAGVYQTCAIREGVLRCWGWDRSGELGDGSDGGSRGEPAAVDSSVTSFVEVSCGRAHTCARTETGETYCWGCGGTCTTCGYDGETLECTGALGTGDAPELLASPALVPGLRSRRVSIGGSACAVTSDGALVCWGPNESGELGVGDTMPRLSPTELITASRWIDVAAGPAHACAVREGGALYCWGDNGRRQLGIGGTAPSLVPARVCLP